MALNLRLNMRPTFGTKLTFVLTPAYFYSKLFYKDIPHYFLQYVVTNIMWSCIFTKYTTEKDSLDSHNNRQSVNVNSVCFVHLMQSSKYILRALRGISFVKFYRSRTQPW